jgi:hypothetical protein
VVEDPGVEVATVDVGLSWAETGVGAAHKAEAATSAAPGHTRRQSPARRCNMARHPSAHRRGAERDRDAQRSRRSWTKSRPPRHGDRRPSSTHPRRR